MAFPNEEEPKKDDSEEFGKVIDALHSKQKLPSLRTYQGDMAEFIKEKNESVLSINMKEKGRREEKEEELKLESFSPKKTTGTKVSFFMIFLSFLLISGGVLGFFYVSKILGEKSAPEQTVKEEVIPYNNLITLANTGDENFDSVFARLSFSEGINIVKISNNEGVQFEKSKDLFGFLKIALPRTLERTLKNEYAIGFISQNEGGYPFIIITINDFGIAFSAMLEWEKSMANDLSFLNAKTDNGNVGTTTDILEPSVESAFYWKDKVVKNRDVRIFSDEYGNSKMAYTFLDKNTILIINSVSIIERISSAFASRSIAR